MIYNKILVALDKSPQTCIVFEEALGMAQKYGSQLMFFHCINSNKLNEPFLSVGTIGDVDMYGALHKQYQQNLLHEIQQVDIWLESCCQQANIKKISAQFKHGFGEAGKQICSLAESWGADLIILGRRGHRGITEILLGSVSSYVLHHAPASVLVVQEQIFTKHKKFVMTTSTQAKM
ncbi:UspA domain protein [Calothrix sp. PCC 7716]|nr:UspA domain protein [Calothrix sp. PCC 7716]